MRNFFVSSVLILANLATVDGAYCTFGPAPGERTNDFPIYDEPLRYIRSVPNAMLFEAGPPDAPFPVVHVWGTPYEVGFAQGTLMKDDINTFVNAVWDYLLEELTLSDNISPWV